MDRTEEFHSSSKLYQNVSLQHYNNKQLDSEPSLFLKYSYKISSCLETNEELVKRIEKLSTMKEFSNDPSEAIREIVELFEGKLSSMQRDLEIVKREAASQKSTSSNQLLQHRQLVVQHLSRTLSEHTKAFQGAAKKHSEHVAQREQRVTKYGRGLHQLKAGGGGLMDSGKYAMFSKLGASVAASECDAINSSTGMRNRHATAAGPTSASSVDAAADRYDASKKYGNSGNMNSRDDSKVINSKSKYSQVHRLKQPQSGLGLYPINNGDNLGQQQQQIQKSRNDFRLRAAEKAEATIAQMGSLFSRMATLVTEQNEVIGRIEDDVEAGLQDTMEANEYLHQVQALTKGNRGMILKIFALLVLFIFLFLVWT